MRNKPFFAGLNVSPAEPKEALEFVRRLKELAERENLKLTEERVRQYISEIPLGRLQSIARRIMMDIMKAPQQELIRLEAEEKPAAARAARPAARRPRSKLQNSGTSARRSRPPPAGKS
jgi:hypothetical protein